MKPSTKDKAKGRLHALKGTAKEVAGKLTGNADLEADGKIEKVKGKVQEKIGEIEEVVGS